MTDRIFEALRDKRRRQLLVELLECSPQETVALPAVIPEEETDAEALYTLMAHNHLPKLEEMEYIRWDRENNEITRGPQFENIEPSLELLITHADAFPGDLI